ncbi:hypothetical protein NDU88_006760 [Pleurodeles waltl]|uniref:Uncharacterized protein n=1 Tax=Pleurodeles waltl TaxID=8319 RepID=A0AAV7L8I6_PLEWA|nr:hypothetical protein NDU88_006760 [Pleurodeles waltl]
MAGRPATARSSHAAPAAPVVSLRLRSPPRLSDPRRGPRGRGGLQKSGPPEERPREFRYLSRAQAISAGGRIFPAPPPRCYFRRLRRGALLARARHVRSSFQTLPHRALL